jgi:hypothetical protein
MAVWSTILSITLLIFANLETVFAYTNFQYHFIFPSNPKIGLILTPILLIAINSAIFLLNNRYKKIEAKFDSESEKQKRKGTFMVLGYIIVSFILFLTTPVVGS